MTVVATAIVYMAVHLLFGLIGFKFVELVPLRAAVRPNERAKSYLRLL